MKRETEGQLSFADYSLNEVRVRLKLTEGETLYSTKPIDCPDAATQLMAGMLSEMDREHCCVVNLDNHLRPISFNIVSVGGINSAMVPVANVFKTAILQNAASLMIMHNHPSGNIEPSKEDISLTQRLLEAGRLLEIPIVDHIIVGGGSDRSYSLRTEMPELFFKNGKTFGAKSSISESEAKYASCADMVKTAANIPEREELSGPTRRM